MPAALEKVETSVPLTCCRRMPPPLPLSAMLPWIRLALITRFRTRAVAQSRRAIRVDLSPANRIGIGRTHDLNSAAVGGNGGVGALVESDRVVLDVAVVDESEVSDTSAFTRADVSAHPVVVELVVVGAGAEGGAAAARQGAGEQFIAERGVAGDVVVVHVDVQVQAVRQVLYRLPCCSGRKEAHRARTAPIGPAGWLPVDNRDRYREFTLADADSARERTGVVVDPVVGDLQVMVPAVDEDAAAALGAVPDREAVNRGRIALVVAGIGVGNEFSRCSSDVRVAIGILGSSGAPSSSSDCWNILEEQGVCRERACLGAVSPGVVSG